MAFPLAVAAYAVLTGNAVAREFYYKVPFAILGAGLAILLAAAGWRALTAEEHRERIPARAFTFGAISFVGTIICLGALFAADQFQYGYVFARASAATDLKYKIAGIWAGQEGSFLLWGCMSALFGVLGARVAGKYRRWFTVSFAIFLLAIGAILAYESPFKVHPEAYQLAQMLFAKGKLASAALPLLPPDGAGLTPSLQNYWVVIHPPTIFAGFGSLTLLFCFALSAMITGNAKDWAPIVRPWTLVSLAILALGLCMGGFWAYETLGWGGFWAWDPVENVSFVPWCFVVALTHGLIVQVTRGRWITTNLLLAGLPFILFVYGTFMTRSGFLSDASVHSFAEMNRTALWLLIGILGASFFTFFGFWLFKGLRLGREVREVETTGVHREGAYRSGALLLAALGTATATGMSVPLFQALTGGKPKAVDQQTYQLILSWIFVPIMLLLAAGPFISWRGLPLRTLLSKLLNIFSVSLGVVGILMFVARRFGPAWLNDMRETIQFPFHYRVLLFPWMLFLIWLCAFACIANLWRIVEIWKRGKSSLGGFIAHVGVATLMAGLIISRGLEQKSPVIFVRKDMPAAALGMTVDYLGKTDEQDRHNRENKLLFRVMGEGDAFQAKVGQYYVKTQKEGEEEEQMAWPYIHRTLWHDVYFTTQEMESEGKPFSLLPGQSKTISDVTFTYERFEMQGTPGAKGTRLVAHLAAKSKNGGPYRKLAPAVEITAKGPLPVPAPLDDVLYAVPFSVAPGSRELTMQLRYLPTAYGVQIYYKPMTILVWTGAGILAFGGLLTAWFRRRPRPTGPDPAESTLPNVEIEKHAPAPVA